MSDQYIGEIRMFSGNYAPKGWNFCDGSLLPISQNEVLFAAIGTVYGGDGRTTFALPDLRGRLPLHLGKSSAGTNYALGQTGGSETVALLEAHMPSHTHVVNASNLAGTSMSPSNAYWAAGSPYSTSAPNGQMANGMISSIGSNQAHANVMPYRTINFIIALQGIFPSPS